MEKVNEGKAWLGAPGLLRVHTHEQARQPCVLLLTLEDEEAGLEPVAICQLDFRGVR